MPLRTDTIDLADEADRLRERREAKAAEQVEFPMGSDGARQAAQEGQQADRYLAGIEWAREEYDAETVTFGALTNGERHLVGDLVDRNAEGATGARQNAYIAVATRDAPYLEHDPEQVAHPEEEDAVRETAMNVANAHPAFADWAESKISDLDRVDGETGKSYRELVLEKRRQATSEAESG